MKLDQPRPNTFHISLSAHELSTLLAAARMSQSLMETDPSGATERARTALAAVLAEFDAALERLRPHNGERAP